MNQTEPNIEKLLSFIEKNINVDININSINYNIRNDQFILDHDYLFHRYTKM